MVLAINVNGQIQADKFGKGIKFEGQDSSYLVKFGFRFQNLAVGQWNIIDGSLQDYSSEILIRRSRLKFSGFAHDPRLTFNLELGLTNRDLSGGSATEFRNSPNLVLNAYIAYKFTKTLTIQFGQHKLPGNRERVISSGDLQFVGRSRLNSRFNIDRDVGFQLFNEHTLGSEFFIKESIALSQGEGRNVTEGHYGAYNITLRAEFYPLGSFQSEGDYVGSAIKREERPKLAVGFTYDMNNNAVRERGQLGNFIIDNDGNYLGRDLNTFFMDCMFKYKSISFMGEYAYKKTANDDSFVIVDGEEIGTYYTGNGLNLQVGYMLDTNWEIATRYTDINPDEGIDTPEERYTLGLSKFIVGHELKIQMDLTYRNRDGRDNGLIARLQTEIHF